MVMVRRLACLLGVSLTLFGCAHLAPPKQNAAKLMAQTRSSIVTGTSVSASTRSSLLSSGYEQDSCMNEFADCIDGIKALSLGKDSRQTLAVLAELYYTKAQQLSAMDDCRMALDREPIDPNYANAPPSQDELLAKKQAQQTCTSNYRDTLYHALKHSYAYLFYQHLQQSVVSNTHLASDTDARIQDIYHLTINDIVRELYAQERGAFASATQFHYGLDKPTIEPVFNQVTFNKVVTTDDNQPTTLTLSLENNPYYLSKLAKGGQHVFSDLVSAYDARLSKLDVNSRRFGLGVSFVGSIGDRYTAQISQSLGQSQSTQPTPNDPQYQARIHQMGHVLLTAVIIPKGNTLDEVLGAREFDGYFFNPQQHKEIKLFDTSYPLAANFSAGYALWLSENQLKQLSILNMLAKKDSIALPQLFMLEPYDPNQKVVIMLHGLASSPATWVNLTNTLLSDPELNERYQVWQIAYSTNLPILENRYQIAKLIEHSFASVDPTGNDVASHHAILIGHSMGGVISRLMVSDDKLMPKLQQLESKDQRKLYNQMSYAQKQALEQRFTLNALPQVDTAVFLSAPFRGTDYADRWFTRAARRIIHLPLDLTQMVGNTLMNLGEDDNSVLSSLYLQNGASQLSDRSSFVALTKDVQIHPKVAYHTIMGDNKGIHQAGDSVGNKISDGIVPYSSSHLDGATSETIITGSHNIHENPKTILQLRKILYAHLEKRSD